MSFYPLKDSFGTTQLILNHSDAGADLSALARVPVESAVLIEGTVLLRPSSARRSVSNYLLKRSNVKFLVLIVRMI